MSDNNLYHLNYHYCLEKAGNWPFPAALKHKSPVQRTDVHLRSHLPFSLLKNKSLGEVNPG
ncbi:hypothetical protein ACG2F4_02650 [Halalkalibaculum sp. DA3122]|uniref:hypothetical protein n=1 Tax=unclassified Halalkalibaculum TaxID=2964617 RepID=UPI003754D495